MGKMLLRGKQRRGRGQGSAAEGGAELQQLVLRQRQQEALQQNDGFAEARVEVVVRSIEQVPFALGLKQGWVVQFFRGVAETVVQMLDQLYQGRDFVKKLGTLAEKNSAADSVEAGGTAALGQLKIVGIQRAEIGNSAKVLGMPEHRAQQRQERDCESLAKCGSHRERLTGFPEPAMATKSERLIQIDTEHRVSCFKSAQSLHVRSGFLRV